MSAGRIVLTITGVLTASIPLWSDGTYYTYLALVVLIYGIAAIGLNILTGYAGQLSLGHAAFMAIGAYCSTLLSIGLADSSPFWSSSGLHVLIGVICGTLSAAACGGILSVPALRLRGPYLAMVTIAFGWIIWRVLLEWVPVTGGDLGISSVPGGQLLIFPLGTRSLFYVVFALFIATLRYQKRLIDSRFGLLLRAVKHSEMAAASIGVDVHHMKIATFMVSAAIAGFAGALFAHQQEYINPDSFQFFRSVYILLAVLFGGAGTMLGPIAGTTVLHILPELMHDFEKYRLIVYGILMLLTLYFLPTGMVGGIQQRWCRMRGRGRCEGLGDEIDFARVEIEPINGAVLDSRGVTHTFGGLVALSNVNLHIEKGAIHALIGPNGAGKTTLINIISGVIKPNCGTVLVDSDTAKVGSLNIAARLGIVRTFQNIEIFGDMTVLEHVLVGLFGIRGNKVLYSLLGFRSDREEWARLRNEALQILEFVGILHLHATPVNALAHGHRRMVEIARAVATRPRVLLLDEPASGLVAEEIQKLAALILAIKDMGITILLVGHNMDLVLGISDHVTVLDRGKVIAEGTPADIRRDKNVIAAYLGDSDAVT